MRRQYLSDRFDVLQLVESRVELVEPDMAVDPPADRQAPFLVEANEARNVADGHARAHVASTNRLFLADEIALVDAEARADFGQTGDHQAAAVFDDGITHVHRIDAARKLERIVDAAARQR